MEIQDSFVYRMTALYGRQGSLWLDQLPQLIRYCEERWTIRVQPSFPNLSYNYVAPAFSADGNPLVLKLGVPNPELISEIAALRHYNGKGAVRLLNSDVERGILLMERLQPGIMLSALDDDIATIIAAQVMRELWRPMPADGVNQFRTVEGWALGMQNLRRTFDGGCGPFPQRLVERAERLFDELLASTNTNIVLHGDLHHTNILSVGDTWLAIDPKGVIGDPAYEVGALLRNPWPQVTGWPNLSAVLHRRVDILTEALDVDRQRIVGWGIAQAVLAAWWTFEEDEMVDDRWLVIADAL